MYVFTFLNIELQTCLWNNTLGLDQDISNVMLLILLYPNCLYTVFEYFHYKHPPIYLYALRFKCFYSKSYFTDHHLTLTYLKYGTPPNINITIKGYGWTQHTSNTHRVT